MTRADLMEGNPDLIAAAGALLAKARRYRLDAEVAKASGGSQTLALRTEGLDRVDVWVDGRPRASVDTSGGKLRVKVPAGAVEVRGFDGGELAAARRLG
jgi:hypothetical protein